MIVDLNIKQLGMLVLELEKMIEECEESELNIFNQLKEACVSWQDGNSKNFDEQISNEKTTTHYFLLALQNDCSIFRQIYEEYKAIGDKLYFNLEKKDAIFKAIDNCISKANSALNDLNNVDRSFYYSELELIDNQKAKIINARNYLKTMKDKINELYLKIKIVEERISVKIGKLEELIVGRFAYNFN